MKGLRYISKNSYFSFESGPPDPDASLEFQIAGSARQEKDYLMIPLNTQY